jgi:glycosyl-4,4'-diaponeurosporenoate acyltransferase
MKVRRFHPSKPRAALLDVVAWGLVHAATGYLAHRIPAGRLQRDGWLTRPRPWEADGRLYTTTLRIHEWKDRVPEAGALFAGGTSKAHVTRAGVEELVVETRRAELAHWWAAGASPLFVLWNPWYAVPLLVSYGLGVNLPFIAIQRYNRLRATRVLARRSSTPRSRTASVGRDDVRAERGSSGSSIP